MLLSFYQTQDLLHARDARLPETDISLDLGLSLARVRLTPERVHLPEDASLSWDEVQHIHNNPQAVFRIVGHDIEKVQVFSEQFGRLYSLMPTAGAPTMLISGIPMHRIKNTDPM